MRFSIDIHQIEGPDHPFPKGSYRVTVVDESSEPHQVMAVYAPTIAEAIDGASQALIARVEDDL